MAQVETTLTTDELRERVDRLPRLPFGHLPTPLEYLPRFTQAIGGPPVYIKRDDCTGLAFGGNKTRHNEFLIADALEKGAELVVWGAGVQSNNCRQTAAACAKAGLDIHLVLGRGKPADGPDLVQGNLLLDHLVGAHVEIIDGQVGPEVDARIAEVADEYRQAGRNVYEWDRYTVKSLAAVSYVLCLVEIIEQAREDGQLETRAGGWTPQAVYGCSAGSTGAGMVLAAAALGAQYPVRHVAPIVWPWDTRADMAKIATEAGERIGVDASFVGDDIELFEEFVGPDYGVVTPGCLEAMAVLARTEGILVDPSYSGKALAGLIDHIRSGRLDPEEPVVFVHTGGTPALFAYNEVLSEQIAARSLAMPADQPQVTGGC